MRTPGFHCVNIFCCQCYAGTVSLRLSQMNVSVETKTKDNVFVIIKVSVQYEVLPDKVEDFFYRLASPKQQMEAYVFDVVRYVLVFIDSAPSWILSYQTIACIDCE